jgi:hypothetical protein
LIDRRFEMTRLEMARLDNLKSVKRAEQALARELDELEVLHSRELEQIAVMFPDASIVVHPDHVSLVEYAYTDDLDVDEYMDSVSYDGRRMSGWIEQEVGTVADRPVLYKFQVERHLTDDEKVLLANMGKLTTETVTEVRLTCG